LIASGRDGTSRLEEGPDGFFARRQDRVRRVRDPAPDQACEQIVNWTRFAGTKAALVLTVDGIFGSFLVPAISRLTQGTRDAAALAASALFVEWARFVALSCTEAFRCILPKALNAVHTAMGRCAHFRPAAIATQYPLDRPTASATRC
jgi:hypothetical protein